MDKRLLESIRKKLHTTLLGVAIGDALGVPVEFMERGAFQIAGMTGFGTHNQPPGTWSDDTSLTLALACALAESGLDLKAVAQNFVAWRDQGLFTPHGIVFDIGGTTSRAISRLKQGVLPERAGATGQHENGNGSLMRIAPLVIHIYDLPPEERYLWTRKVSSLTHAHPVSVTACFIYVEMLRYLLFGLDHEEAYHRLKAECNHDFLDALALKHFERILSWDIRDLPEDEIESSGYVVDTLEAAFWAFLTTRSYSDAVLKAINLGDDTDTTGAVTGGLAGMYYGVEGIPQAWQDGLVRKELFSQIQG